jgi:hypothetical protein
MDKWFSHIPEETELPPIDIIPVALKEPERDIIAIFRPTPAMIITILENKMPQAVNPIEYIFAVMAFNLSDVVSIVVVKDVDSAGGRFQHYGIGIFRTIRRFHRDRR